MVHCLDQMNHNQLQQLEVFGETGNGALISAIEFLTATKFCKAKLILFANFASLA